MSTATVAAPVRMSDKQMKALKYLISQSRDMSALAKKILFWLLDQTDNLTRPVRINVVPDDHNPNRNDIEITTARQGFHNILSANCSTHLHAVLTAMGSTLGVSWNSGFVGSSEKDRQSGPRGTFAVWISSNPYDYDCDATLLEVDWNAVIKMDIESGLYSSSQR